MSSPTSSFLSLNINNITFLITKAHIKESLESLWRIECEGYIESLQEHPFALDSFTSIKNNSHITSALNNPASTLNFHPDTLINKQAVKEKSLHLQYHCLVYHIKYQKLLPQNKNHQILHRT